MSSERTPITTSNVPCFTIDLSLPPKERYKALALAYKPQIQHIILLFDALLGDLGIPVKFHLSINRMARLLLRGTYSATETAELRGIAEVTGVSMYLLVALNVVLDLLMGCTSGAVISPNDNEVAKGTKMLHFRTLDWGMDPLRSIVVQLNFVRSKSQQPSAILASSITYVGFVGVLTGVRSRLSMSLNFRAVHNAATRKAQARFYLHHLLVLLGFRQSISSLLRTYLFSDSSTIEGEEKTKELEIVVGEIGPRHTTAAYLVFSDGQRAIAMEKDFETAVVRQSDMFIVATNHDVDETVSEPNSTTPAAHAATSIAPNRAAGMEELLEDSMERMECVSSKWAKKLRQARRTTRKKRCNSVEDNSIKEVDNVQSKITVSESEVIQWVTDWPTTNETSHFATVMDPLRGRFVWSRVYHEPVSQLLHIA